MVTIPSKVGSEIQAYELAIDELFWIGRLVRATAELEDILKSHICALADLEFGAATVLLGRMPTSARLGIAKAFAESRGGKVLADYKACFESENFKKVIKCRNTVAHGVLLGKTDTDCIAFEVQDTQLIDEQGVVVTVIAYPSQAFRQHAEAAEGMIGGFEDRLKLRASRETRRAQALLPHVKAQRQGKPKRSRSHQPRSSEG